MRNSMGFAGIGLWDKSIVYDPRRRLSARACLVHPYCEEGGGAAAAACGAEGDEAAAGVAEGGEAAAAAAEGRIAAD